jgi:subtilase family serine protease
LQIFRIVLTVAAIYGLAACSGSHMVALPGDSTRQIQDTPHALPGDTPHALPGDTPHALPGAQLGCDLTFQADQANCTIAINITIPPVSDVTTPANLLAGLHPADLQNRYVLPSQNSGTTVAIVDAYDDPAAENDLAVYRTAFGLPSCTSSNGCFRKVNQQGQSSSYPAVNAGWDEEISLDLDMISAVCPNCKILLVEANSPSFDDLGAAVDSAASLGAKAISNSYYGPEWSGETAYDAHYKHAGVAITVSAGDEVSPFYPAASPNVTAIGGTSLSGSAGSWTESAWQYTGQGCSTYESRPSWQNSTGCKTRAAVDVAAIADPQTGVTMYDSTAGGWLVAGGTSVGAPVIAAAYALSGNPQGPAYSYAHRSAFYDIPPAGYDLPTGLGTPNGVSGL